MKRNPIIFLFILIVIASCNSIYLPNSHNVPFFEKAGDFQLGGQGQVYVPSFTLGFQGQGAYAVSNHIGAIANYGFMKTASKGKGQLGEIALGYYTNRGPRNYSVFLGSGVSSAREYTGIGDTSYLNTDYKSVFLQPAYGFAKKRHTVSISMKVILIDSEDTYYSKDFIPLSRNRMSWHFEPAFTWKMGLGEGPFQLVLQGGLHFTDYDDVSYMRNFGRLAVGVQWKLGKKAKE